MRLSPSRCTSAAWAFDILLVLCGLTVACGEQLAPSASHFSLTQRIVDGQLATDDPTTLALVSWGSSCALTPALVDCSAVLLAPRVALTAAHCAQPIRQGEMAAVFFGDDLTGDEGSWVRVAEALIHPDYDPFTNEFDAALLLLEDTGPEVTGVSLPTAERNVAALAPDASVRIVGFGITEVGDTAPNTAGRKREGTMQLTMVGDILFETAPGSAVSCGGDSGGPVFAIFEDTEVLIGLSVDGDQACEERAGNLRVDILLEDFITPFLEVAETSPAYPTLDAISSANLCDGSCEVASDCPAGLRCDAGFTPSTRCLTPQLGEGEYGDTCQSDAQCGTNRCARLWPTGDDACRCFEPCSDGVVVPDIPPDVPRPDTGPPEPQTDTGAAHDHSTHGHGTVGGGRADDCTTLPNRGASPTPLAWVLVFVVVGGYTFRRSPRVVRLSSARTRHGSPRSGG